MALIIPKEAPHSTVKELSPLTPDGRPGQDGEAGDAPVNCPRCLSLLDEIYAPEGVLVDFCRSCKGSWYDKGELLFLSKRPRQLGPLLERPLISPRPSEFRCPRCQAPMEAGGLGSPDLLVDRCPTCGGLWLDAKERAKLDEIASTKLAILSDRAAPSPGAPPAPIPLSPLPNLALRSTAVLLSLYGLVFLALLLAVEAFGAGLEVAVLSAIVIIAVQYFVAPFLMDLFLRLLQSLHWVSKDELPPHLTAFIERVCQTKKIPFPRVGIIEDGNPNAFTYGHHPRNASLILTSGLIEILDEEELRAVVGHELGHVLHWDILVMTLASLAPVLLYYLYKVLSRVKSKGKNPLPLVALLCYVFYLISEYLVLFLSRVREYYADRFSGEITQDPNALAKGLVKIAYGLAAARREEAEEKARSPLRAVAPLGIFDPKAALNLAVAGGGGGDLSREDVVGAMQWDLWNPWAGFYELASTHPLPAKRIKALGDLASHYHQRPLVSFDVTKPESYWDEFFVDLLIMALPILFPLAVLAFMGTYGLAIVAFGFGSLIRTLFEYRGSRFPEVSVASILKKVKVSAIRCYPVALKGKIIGRGIPGLIYSEDLVLQDATGFIFLDYRQPWRVIDFWFGLFRTPGLIGREAVVEGWYRRAPVPYVEMKRLSYEGRSHRCYTYHVKLIVALLTCAIGLGVMLIGG